MDADNMKKQEYTVYYVISKNNHGYLCNNTVTANNQQEAIKLTKTHAKEMRGHHAFCCTCKRPEKTEKGLLWSGMWYTKYSETTKTLW